MAIPIYVDKFRYCYDLNLVEICDLSSNYNNLEQLFKYLISDFEILENISDNLQ